MISSKPRNIIITAIASLSFAGAAVPAVSQADNPIVEFQSSASSKCLQPLNGSQGAPIVQETCNGTVVQQWTQTSGSASNTYHYVNRSSQLCLDARGVAATGTPIEQWTCNGISNENWSEGNYQTASHEELYSHVSKGNGGRCVYTPGKANGDEMYLNSCDGDASTFWNTAPARLAPPTTLPIVGGLKVAAS